MVQPLAVAPTLYGRIITHLLAGVSVLIVWVTCCMYVYVQVARLQWTAMAFRPKMMAKYAVKK